MSGESSVLRFEDVSLRFGDAPALDHVSFELRAGETRVVFGAAGSGKTMMLKTALGLQKADSGRVILFGEDVTDLKESAMYPIRSRVGILFQEGGLFDSLTIAENVAYPLLNQQSRRNGDGPPAARPLGFGKPPNPLGSFERPRDRKRRPVPIEVFGANCQIFAGPEARR